MSENLDGFEKLSDIVSYSIELYIVDTSEWSVVRSFNHRDQAERVLSFYKNDFPSEVHRIVKVTQRRYQKREV